MNRNKWFKVFASFNFGCLIVVFPIYRNGSFDSFFQPEQPGQLSSPNGGTQTTVTNNVGAKDTAAYTPSESVERMASSKVIVITKPASQSKLQQQMDSLAYEQKKREENLRMFGSKSGIVIDPKLLKNDSTKLANPDSKNKK